MFLYMPQVQGEVKYNGVPLRDFVTHQTAAYVDQSDLHAPELTVRETLDFASRCQRTGFGRPYYQTLHALPRGVTSLFHSYCVAHH